MLWFLREAELETNSIPSPLSALCLADQQTSKHACYSCLLSVISRVCRLFRQGELRVGDVLLGVNGVLFDHKLHATIVTALKVCFLMT